MDKTRILIVDDHPLMRAALREIIELKAEFEIIGEAVNGAHALEMALKFNPQVILMDLYMPIMDGIEATQKIVHSIPGVKILVITSSNDDEKIIAAIRAGAAGILLKDSSREHILFGLREIANGHRFIPQEIGARLACALQAEHHQVIVLTSREEEVLIIVGEGSTKMEIANKLAISEATVRVHISNIMQKLDVKDRSQVAIFAQRNRIQVQPTP